MQGRRVGAGEGLAEELTRGREALELLDAIVSTGFAKAPKKLPM